MHNGILSPADLEKARTNLKRMIRIWEGHKERTVKELLAMAIAMESESLRLRRDAAMKETGGNWWSSQPSGSY